MELKFTKSSDQKHQVKLDSSLVYAEWTQQTAYSGMAAGVEIGTLCVGDGAPVTITVRSERGKTISKTSGMILRNRYRAGVPIPDSVKPGEMVYFDAQLPKHGLKVESFKIVVLPKIKISDLHWGSATARRGSFVEIKANVQNAIDDTDVLVTIYEYDEDGAHDKIVEIPARVKSERLEIIWEYVYTEDTDDIATEEDMAKFDGKYRFPEYFFALKIAETEIGKQKESGLLRFQDHIDLVVTYNDKTPLSNRKFVIELPDQSKQDGVLDDEGRAHFDDVPPGPYKVTVLDE